MSHGWVFAQDGARMALPIIFSRTSRGTGSGLNALMLFLALTASTMSKAPPLSNEVFPTVRWVYVPDPGNGVPWELHCFSPLLLIRHPFKQVFLQAYIRRRISAHKAVTVPVERLNQPEQG